jgi:hypothetical protein
LELRRIVACRLTGDESFIGAGDAESFSVLDYWRWSNSDLVSNASRGILSEYIIGKALGCDLQVRDEWAAYDLLTPSGAYCMVFERSDQSRLTRLADCLPLVQP